MTGVGDIAICHAIAMVHRTDKHLLASRLLALAAATATRLLLLAIAVTVMAVLPVPVAGIRILLAAIVFVLALRRPLTWRLLLRSSFLLRTRLARWRCSVPIRLTVCLAVRRCRLALRPVGCCAIRLRLALTFVAATTPAATSLSSTWNGYLGGCPFRRTLLGGSLGLILLCCHSCTSCMGTSWCDECVLLEP